MDSYKAICLCEGIEEPESTKELMSAWQYIYDNKLYLRLQGWYGRTLDRLIDAGHIKTK
tara:strand:+ start:538 stop:714 length:177 start_codon:yes stop_codon:yes gene_type:complete